MKIKWIQTSEGPLDSTDGAFIGEEDLNLDATNCHALDVPSDDGRNFFEDLDVFDDCQSSLTLQDNEDLNSDHV